MRVFAISAMMTLVLTSTVLSSAQAAPIPTVSGNYCKDEVTEFFAKRFPGEKIESVQKYGSGASWEFWVRNSVCSGYLVFDFSGIEGGQCTTPQYGRRTTFLRRVWAYGTCNEVMPHDEYPY